MRIGYYIGFGVGFLGFSCTGLAQTPSAAPAKEEAPEMSRLAEDVPEPQQPVVRNLVRVSAGRTPSGFPVPRYVSLKYSASNGRTGPSRNHPVAWRYTQKDLPLIVVAETEVWRKVRDINGDESWMDRRLLDGKRMVIARTEIILTARPELDSRKKAVAAKGALLKLDGCQENGWCKVRNIAGNRRGYALQTLLWGAELL